MGSGNVSDLTLFKKQVVQVFSPAGIFIDCWRDAPTLSGFKETMNGGISALEVELPRYFNDINLLEAGGKTTIARGNIVKYYLLGPGLPATGLLRYQGVIDKYEPAIDLQNNQVVKVTLTPCSNVLGDRGTVGNIQFGTPGNSATYIDPVTMFNYFFNTNDPLTGKPYCQPVTLDPGNPTSSGNKFQYTFQAQNTKTQFDTILLLLPVNWFYRFNMNGQTATLNVSPTLPQHVFYIGQHLSTAKYSYDWTQLYNDIYLAGKTSSGIHGRSTGSDLATYGQRLSFKTDSRVSDQTTANAITLALLTLFDQVIVRSPIRVFDYRGDNNPGFGYDIETIKVGDTVEIIDSSSAQIVTLWDQFQWNQGYWDFASVPNFNLTTIVSELTYGFDYVDLALGNPRPNQGKKILEIERLFQDYTMGNQ